tara:strand:- start:1703 stop:3283 length:1581 start_codon:yes stop_codon:yes gene_type:complete
MSKQNLKQIIAAEYQKCATDPMHFMRKYGYIQHPTRGKILFDLYPFQEKSLEEISKHDYSIILKSRQLGISTLTAGYALWSMIFNEDFNVLVIATKQDVAKNLVTKVRVMHQYLPSWLKSTVSEDNKLSLRLTNGSQIKAVSAAGDAGRSEALSLLVMDEAAFIDKIDDIWASSQQTLATGGKCIALSTPNGMGNWFHKQWVKAEDGENRFNTIRLHWTVHPERDQDWRDEQNGLLGPHMAAQECDCDFLSSGNSVISGELLQWYKDTMCQEPVEQRGQHGELWIWEYPDYSRDYMVVADVARGDGGDHSTFHVMDIESVTQVAEFKGQPGTKEFGNMLVNIATEYNEALLVIENANVGWAALQPAIDRGYRNLYYTYKHDGVTDSESHLNQGYDLKSRSQMTPGFTTSSRTRPLLVSKLDIYFREKSCVVKSRRLIDELLVFIWNGNRPEAQRGYNDDLVMAFAISLFVRDHALKLRNEGIELNKLALSNFNRSNGMLYNSNTPKGTDWSMETGKGGKEDITWLI